MTKKEMLKAILNEGTYKAMVHSYINLKKEVIEKAYEMYFSVSHSGARKYLEKAIRNNDCLTKRYQRKWFEK